MTIEPGIDPVLVSRLEDAALSASAPPAQRWLDGWLLRLSPEPMQRARCIHVMADGRRPFAHKLEQAEHLYADAGLPVVFRVTPCTLPGLAQRLDAHGYRPDGETVVLVHDAPHALPRIQPDATGEPVRIEPAEFVTRTAQWRQTAARFVPVQQERVRLLHEAMQAWIWRDADGTVLAGAQVTLDADVAGLYEVHTEPAYRARGIARALCVHALHQAARAGARLAYLQVHADNEPARRLYQGLGFRTAYAYHYRARPDELPGPR